MARRLQFSPSPLELVSEPDTRLTDDHGMNNNDEVGEDVDVADSLVDALTSAAAGGDVTEVRRLLQLGVPVNGKNRFDRTALQVDLLFLICYQLLRWSYPGLSQGVQITMI